MMRLVAFILLVAFVGSILGQSGGLRLDEVRIDVDVAHPDASDFSDGSSARPMKSIGAAVRRAVELKKKRIATRIVVHPGVYREGPIEFAYTNWKNNDPGNDTPIVIEAATIGTVFVRGSEEFDAWKPTETPGVFTHDWAYSWGVSPNPWKGDREVADIVLRREMLFLDGQRLDQVLREKDLAPGRFLIDERTGRVVLNLESGSLPADHLIELAVRERLWDQNYENNVTIRGINFEHASTPWDPGDAAVRISGSRNVVFEDCKVSNTNWQGLYVGESSNIKVLSSEMNDNGGQGWGFFRVTDIEAVGNETSRNNWRGHLGGFDGWSMGNKLLSVHNALIKNHVAVENYSRGIWLDYDISAVVLDSVILSRNSRDGLWIEASQGPVTVKNSTISDNVESGIRSTYSRLVVIDNNRITGNGTSQIELDGTGTRVTRDFESRRDLPLTLREWVITHNEIHGPVSISTGQVVKRADWTEFLSHLVIDENRYSGPGGNTSFRILNDTWTFANWQARTGQDRRSSTGS